MTHTGNYTKQPDTSVLLQSARFCTTAATFAQLPADALPEVAFVGRSNAGKSSAINVLCGQRRLAFASKTPGRTQHINLFDVGLGGGGLRDRRRAEQSAAQYVDPYADQCGAARHQAPAGSGHRGMAS